MSDASTSQKLPPLMHFPLAKHLATIQGRSIRRVGWTGKPGAHELAWICYRGGLWWYQNAAGERVAESGDVDEHDFLALDWTTLAPDCDPAEHQNAGLPADATIFGIRPYDLWEDVGAETGLRDLAESERGTRCRSLRTTRHHAAEAARGRASARRWNWKWPWNRRRKQWNHNRQEPVAPPTLPVPIFPVEAREEAQAGDHPDEAVAGGDARARPTQPSFPRPLCGSPPVPPSARAASNALRTVADVGAGMLPIPCMTFAELAWPTKYLGATISLGADQDQPGSVWFYRYYYKGELRDDGHDLARMEQGRGRRRAEVRSGPGASHSGRVEFGHGSDTVSATDTVTMPDYCQKDPNCGKPCGGGDGGGGGGGSDWGGSW